MKLSVQKAFGVFCIAVLLVLLYLSSRYNYLLFHTLAEVFSICIGFTVFLISWNSMHYIRNNYLKVIGIAYFFIGFLDLFHTMSYKGMQIFGDYQYYANQLWVAARYFESIVLLVSFLYVRTRKQVDVYALFAIYSVATALIFCAIFFWRVFPVCFIDGVGLTPFKKNSEYIICLILLAAIVTLHWNRGAFEGIVYRFLITSMVFTIFSELAFTEYMDNYGLFNLAGHYFKIFSFYLIYKTIIVKGIQEPYDVIFREMKQTEQKLFEQNEILKNQAAIDGLTGLYNHRHIYEHLKEEVERCKGGRCTFAVMILDIDRFKAINDTYGHLMGDKILRELALLLKVNSSSASLVGRYGGEEFLVMYSNMGILQGIDEAERIRKTVENHAFRQGIRLTLSIGVEEFYGEKVSELLEKADNKLYQAKNGGRNKTVG